MNYLLACCIMTLNGISAKNCVDYKEGEVFPSPPIGGRECFNVMDDSNRYCVHFDCPTPECSDPITPEYGCPYCNGTCIRGGEVHKDGEWFSCPDGCNRCPCNATTLAFCIWFQPPKECQN